MIQQPAQKNKKIDLLMTRWVRIKMVLQQVSGSQTQSATSNSLKKTRVHLPWEVVWMTFTTILPKKFSGSSSRICQGFDQSTSRLTKLKEPLPATGAMQVLHCKGITGSLLLQWGVLLVKWWFLTPSTLIYGRGNTELAQAALWSSHQGQAREVSSASWQ